MSAAALRVRLVRREAPAYWSRWDVEVDGRHIGRVEKRGGSAAWTAHTADGTYLGGMIGRRTDAVAALVEHARTATS